MAAPETTLGPSAFADNVAAPEITLGLPAFVDNVVAPAITLGLCVSVDEVAAPELSSGRFARFSTGTAMSAHAAVTGTLIASPTRMT